MRNKETSFTVSYMLHNTPKIKVYFVIKQKYFIFNQYNFLTGFRESWWCKTKAVIGLDE